MATYERFNDYVNLYDKYRLKYNIDVLNDIIKALRKDISISSIADIGSGTGILTRQLLKYKFDNYFSLEPNEKMQEKSIEQDTKNQITHMSNLSTKTSLKTSSIDVIFVGTAIHWFEPKKTLKEFKRILKKKGYLVILTSGYVGSIGEDTYILHKKHKSQIKSAEVSERYDKGMKNYSNKFYTIISRNTKILTLDEFVGLELSMSTSPKPIDDYYDIYIKGLNEIFKKHAKNNKLYINNKTTALISDFSCLL
jgi:ubiquinone/menaquinone biosynthesis C-methylase UbiE